MEESTQNSIQFLPVPVMHKAQFAQLVGVSYGVVDGWCNRNYLPTVSVGKHTLVNIALLTQECLENLPR